MEPETDVDEDSEIEDGVSETEGGEFASTPDSTTPVGVDGVTDDTVRVTVVGARV